MMYFCESIFGDRKNWSLRDGVLYGIDRTGKEVEIPKESIERYMKNPRNLSKNFENEFTPSFYGTFLGGFGGLATYNSMGDEYTPTERMLATGAAALVPSIGGIAYSYKNSRDKLRTDVVNKYMAGKI